MNKALEYIRDISCLIAEHYSDKAPLTEEQKLSKNCFLDYCKYIAKELQLLEQIDNAKSSEALNCLEKLGNIWHTGYTGKIRETALYNTIKQALIKAQEQEKVLEIIKEKSVDIKHLKWCINNPKKLTTPLLNYNIDMNKNEELTEEEYDLLKEVVGKWIEN